jgi:hypothetical protein
VAALGRGSSDVRGGEICGSGQGHKRGKEKQTVNAA